MMTWIHFVWFWIFFFCISKLPRSKWNNYNESHLFHFSYYCDVSSAVFFSISFRFVSFLLLFDGTMLEYKYSMFDDCEAAKIFMTLITLMMLLLLQRGQRLNYSPMIISISTKHELITSKQIKSESDRARSEVKISLFVSFADYNLISIAGIRSFLFHCLETVFV